MHAFFMVKTVLFVIFYSFFAHCEGLYVLKAQFAWGECNFVVVFFEYMQNYLGPRFQALMQ